MLRNKNVYVTVFGTVFFLILCVFDVNVTIVTVKGYMYREIAKKRVIVSKHCNNCNNFN